MHIYNLAGNPLGYESLRQSKLGNFFDLKELWIRTASIDVRRREFRERRCTAAN
jgi:hypothetical protein